MVCNYCGTEVNGSDTCPACGAPLPVNPTPAAAQKPVQEYAYKKPDYRPIEVEVPQNSNVSQTYNASYSQQSNRGFSTTLPSAIMMLFANWKDFHSRSTRSEYWWAVLFVGVIGSILQMLLGEGNFLYSLWRLVTLIPMLALTVRRLHDTGRSWTYMLFSLIPIVGWVFMLVALCADSGPANQWGPNLKQNRY